MKHEKYILHFLSKTKKKMIKFIENQLIEEGIEDLVPAYGNILTALYNNDGRLMMKDIATIVGKDKSTITALIKSLLKLGYVKKIKSKQDKRITYIELTEKSYTIKNKFEKISNELNQKAFYDFTVKEKEEFLKLLKKMNNNFS
ncbi:MAG TPA: MarR family transcriptional regulator [Clostridia bacterium]|nr:MarR family transcriptional regulator [Clostridia bacterium]